MTTVAELFANIGFKIDESNLTKFKIGLTVAVATILKFTADVVKATVELDNFEKRSGVASETIRNWQLIGQQANISANSITSAFETITQARGELLTGSGNIKPWALLGVDPNQDPEVVFQNIIDKLGSISDVNVRNQRILDLGLDPQRVNLIGKTKDSISGLNKSLLQTKTEKQALLDLNKSWLDLKLTLGLVKEKFASYLFPLKSFVDLIKRLVDITVKVIDGTVGWAGAISLLTLAFSYLLITTFPLTALFLFLALAIEDVWTYFEGGESVTKAVMDWFKNLSTGMQDFITIIGFLIAKFFLASKITSVVIKIGKSLLLFKKILTTVGVAMKLFALTNPFTAIILGIGLAITGLVALYNWWKKFKKKGKDEQESLDLQELDNLKNNIGYIEPQATNQNNSSYVNNQPNITNTFNIDGAREPQVVANQVFSFQEQVNTASLLTNKGY